MTIFRNRQFGFGNNIDSTHRFIAGDENNLSLKMLDFDQKYVTSLRFAT